MSDNLLRANIELESIGLLGDNVSFLKKRKKRPGDFVQQSFENIVGTELIRAQAAFI